MASPRMSHDLGKATMPFGWNERPDWYQHCFAEKSLNPPATSRPPLHCATLGGCLSLSGLLSSWAVSSENPVTVMESSLMNVICWCFCWLCIFRTAWGVNHLLFIGCAKLCSHVCRLLSIWLWGCRPLAPALFLSHIPLTLWLMAEPGGKGGWYTKDKTWVQCDLTPKGL